MRGCAGPAVAVDNSSWGVWDYKHPSTMPSDRAQTN
eukprot:SAG11_NODE_35946_length_264_cov_0.630303_1_plen_35_part_01